MNTVRHPFFDERIEAVHGRVMRECVWFITALTAVYALLFSGGVWLYLGYVPGHLLITEAAVLLSGVCMVMVGELVYRHARQDEMIATEQGRFYRRAFYVLIYIAAFAYCLHVAVSLRSTPVNPAPTVGMYPSLLLQLGGLFLLIRLKQNRVMLNYTVMEAPRRVYYKRVGRNMAYLGGMCILFGLCAVVLYMFLRGQSIWEILGILLASVITALSLAGDYFLLSAAERVSDRAERRGRLSGTMLIACMVAVICAVTVAMVYLIASKHFDGTNAGKTVMLYNYLSRSLGTISSMAFAVFALYLAAECRRLSAPNGVRLARAGQRYAAVVLATLVISGLQLHAGLYLTALEHRIKDVERMRILSMGYSYLVEAISLVILILSALCLLDGLQALTAAGHLPRWLIPTVLSLLALQVLLRVLTGFMDVQALSRIVSIIKTVLLFILAAYLYRRVAFETED